MLVSCPELSSGATKNTMFNFTYVIPSMNDEREQKIANTDTLLTSIDLALRGPNTSNPTIKFFIHEGPVEP